MSTIPKMQLGNHIPVIQYKTTGSRYQPAQARWREGRKLQSHNMQGSQGKVRRSGKDPTRLNHWKKKSMQAKPGCPLRHQRWKHMIPNHKEKYLSGEGHAGLVAKKKRSTTLVLNCLRGHFVSLQQRSHFCWNQQMLKFLFYNCSWQQFSSLSRHHLSFLGNVMCLKENIIKAVGSGLKCKACKQELRKEAVKYKL